MAAKRHVLITGPPGVGKTTLCHKVHEVLSSKSIRTQGFYTEEVRSSTTTRSGRLGFDVVTLAGKRGPLARTKEAGCGKRGPTVGNYLVDVQSFEQLALPAITSRSETKSAILIVDEIGKMELFSQPFTQAVRELFASSQATLLATVPIARQRPIPFVEQLKQRLDITLVEVSKTNRDALVSEVVDLVLLAANQSSRSSTN